jgi:heme-degrading monooxygenase HmoA
MTVMVIGRFRVNPGSGVELERAFSGRQSEGGDRPSAQEVHFGRSQDDRDRYVRVGIWPSRAQWDQFQSSERQQAFWTGLHAHLAEEPSFEFFDVVG